MSRERQQAMSIETVPAAERARLRAKCLELAMTTRRDGEGLDAVTERAGQYFAWVLK
jgi:hypothetical protein